VIEAAVAPVAPAVSRQTLDARRRALLQLAGWRSRHELVRSDRHALEVRGEVVAWVARGRVSSVEDAGLRKLVALRAVAPADHPALVDWTARLALRGVPVDELAGRTGCAPVRHPRAIQAVRVALLAAAVGRHEKARNRAVAPLVRGHHHPQAVERSEQLRAVAASLARLAVRGALVQSRNSSVPEVPVDGEPAETVRRETHAWHALRAVLFRAHGRLALGLLVVRKQLTRPRVRTVDVARAFAAAAGRVPNRESQARCAGAARADAWRPVAACAAGVAPGTEAFCVCEVAGSAARARSVQSRRPETPM